LFLLPSKSIPSHPISVGCDGAYFPGTPIAPWH
jgi:hypothetical protein